MELLSLRSCGPTVEQLDMGVAVAEVIAVVGGEMK